MYAYILFSFIILVARFRSYRKYLKNNRQKNHKIRQIYPDDIKLKNNNNQFTFFIYGKEGEKFISFQLQFISFV